MGLDTTHDCWHGPYSYFGKFRHDLCRAAGLGELDDYEGFGGDKAWPSQKAITILLNHSDCDGEIRWEMCDPLADAMQDLAEEMAKKDWLPEMINWIAGLRVAAALHEPVKFH